ncbi:MAG TPA: toll/interleukin-1 receptor domain-containing protein, partial [Chthoniobacterales bacterium]
MIAISYRRQDSSPVAGRLYDRLQAEFGKGNVFMDFDSIPYGVDFREHIKQTLQRAKVVVAIIGPEWTGGKDPASRRIDDPTDFVRLEVASALENGIPVIPVLVNNTPMPDANNLPPELEGLAFRNGLALDTGIDFHHHADRLITGIRRVIDPAKEAASVTVPLKASPAAAPPKRSALLPILITLVAIAGIASWY